MGAGATRFTAVVLILAAVALAGPVAAQSIPEGQSCGGLLCDMGVFGHKTAPTGEAPRPVPAAGAGQGSIQAPGQVAAEPKAAAVRKPKRIAKVAAKAPAKPVAAAAPPPLSAAAPAGPAPGTAVASAPAAVSQPPAAAAEIFVPLTPYASPAGPSRVQLQAISPTY